jgi:hypothetical protein
VAIHRDILMQFKFDEHLYINEDVYLFAQIASLYPIVYVPEISVVWVLHGHNTADQEKDYYSPQLIATRKILSDQVLAPLVSKSFRKAKYFDLYTQLVYFYAVHKNHIKAFLCFLKGVYWQPSSKQNVTNWLNVIYHLPGGDRLKKAVRLLKGNKD